MTTLALLLVVVTLALVIWLAIELLRVRRQVDAVPSDGGVFSALNRLDSDLAAVEHAVADMRPRLGSVEARLPLALQYTAVVSYDAFDNIAGNMSRSIALLNGNGDGFVVSLLVARDETRWFTKMVRSGQGTDPLSPEEQAAVREALEGRAQG